MILAATITLLLHVLPPFRPLTQRLKSADAVAIIELTSQTRTTVKFKSLAQLKGKTLTDARLLPGHRPPSKALYGLATFTQQGGQWFIQEQGREWIELQPSERRMHPLLVWQRWIKGLIAQPNTNLLRSLIRAPFDRYAARDLNALILIPTNDRLRLEVAHTLSKERLAPKIAESLKHTLLKVTPVTERSHIKRCLLGDKSCLGR